MKRQLFYLPRYDWHIDVFYDTVAEDADKVIDALMRLDCPQESLKRSYKSIVSGGTDTGMTYTSTDVRESVMVIGRASTLAQFLNTWSHECIHLNRHMCEFLRVDPFSEEAAYLYGDIAQKMHPLLEEYMCSCKKSPYFGA